MTRTKSILQPRVNSQIVVPIDTLTETQQNLQRVRPVALICGFVLGVMLVSMGIYAYYAPLAKGVIAPGQVVVLSNRKIVQHQEGGTVAAIYVTEGEQVYSGQVLVKFDSLLPERLMERLLKERDDFWARSGMLEAQQSLQRKIKHNENLIKRRHIQRIARIIADYDRVLNTTWSRIDGQTAIYKQTISVLKKTTLGLKNRIAALHSEQILLKENLAKQKRLLDEKLTSEEHHNELQRELIRLDGEQAQLRSEFFVVEDEIIIEEQKLKQLLIELQDAASIELADIRSKLEKLEDDIVIQQDILQRTEIRAPQDGLIFNLQVHTIGGVIAPGQPLMEIVPSDVLVVEARINLQDIDNVALGQETRLRFSAFKQRTTPELHGTVTELSADARTLDPNSPPFYIARVTPAEDELSRLGLLTVVPGMPVEILFKGEERTLFDYFSSLFTDLHWRAMTEE